MGRGGINRLLLSKADLESPTSATLLAEDPRTLHIRTILLSSTAPNDLNIRIALEGTYTHDAAPVALLADGAVRINLPVTSRKAPSESPPIILLLAMQRPKVTGRILSAAASLGVKAVLFVATEKVEKSYWDCKLFRRASSSPPPHSNTPPNPEEPKADTPVMLPGRPRGPENHPERDTIERKSAPANLSFTRVDSLPSVRRRLLDGVQQASHDATLPQIALIRQGIGAALSEMYAVYGECKGWARLVAHPPRDADSLVASVTKTVGASETYGAVLAIGPEGGWTDEEVALLEREGFCRASLGERVLRSETAVVVAVGLVHEGLRMWKELRRDR